MGKLHGVPELPPHYLSRVADIFGLKRKLLAGDGNVGITGQSSAAVGVQGMGGIGKSVFAAARLLITTRDREVGVGCVSCDHESGARLIGFRGLGVIFRRVYATAQAAEQVDFPAC
jgi:hypothetical protein